jgi:hypothetical protein
VASKNKDVLDIVIKSEEDAYAILEMAARNEIGDYGAIRFDGWPTLSIYLKGEKFEQSITPTVMKGLLELQRGVYRSYASAKFNTPNRRLSDQERDELEIKVSVGGGSSSFEINFQEIAVKLIEQLGPRMNPTEVLYTVVSIAVLYFGTSAYRSYLENRKDIRAREVSDETQRATLEAMKFASEQETKRTAIIASLASQDQRVESIANIAHDAHTEVVKCLSAGTEAKLDGINLPPEVSEVLTQNARRQSSDVRLDGTYRILKLDWSDPVRFKVKVQNIKTGAQVDAEVQDDSLTGKYKDALKAAEWSRKPVILHINAKQIGDDVIRDATVISAELLAESDSPE